MTASPHTESRELFGNAVGSTLVTALYAKAFGARDFDVQDWDDPVAGQAWRALEESACEHGITLHDLVLKQRMNVVGTIRRSQAFDDRVRDFATAYPGAQVVTLGVGLCTRAARLTDLQAEWVGIDFPAVADLRGRILPDDATRLIGASATEAGWLADIDPTRPTIYVVEGLLMYLDTPRVTQLLVRIGDHHRSVTRLSADVHHSRSVRGNAQITALTGARYGFGIQSPAAFAALSPGWHLVRADDTMSSIAPAAARISRTFAVITRSMLYGVVTIESDRRAV